MSEKEEDYEIIAHRDALLKYAKECFQQWVREAHIASGNAAGAKTLKEKARYSLTAKLSLQHAENLRCRLGLELYTAHSIVGRQGHESEDQYRARIIAAPPPRDPAGDPDLRNVKLVAPRKEP